MISVWDPIVKRPIETVILMKLQSTATEIIIENRVSQFFSRFVPNLLLLIETYEYKI